MENLRHWQSSQKAYRAHLTKLHRIVVEIMDSSKLLEHSALDSLSTSIDKLQQKAKAIGEQSGMAAPSIELRIWSA